MKYEKTDAPPAPQEHQGRSGRLLAQLAEECPNQWVRFEMESTKQMNNRRASLAGSALRYSYDAEIVGRTIDGKYWVYVRVNVQT